ncbi:M28 family peptidase [Massilia sp. X63]|uniref:M28 family peptidase n=1 Tax=Massilia sp. X63 TaxID=3237285 RepID=UPI0034DCFE29
MRKLARSHWKLLIAILLAVALATLTLDTDSAARAPRPEAGPELSVRLRAHVSAIASREHNTATPHALEQAARHIETTLQGYGYQLRRQEYEADGQQVRNIEVSVANTAPGAKPERIFIVGAHYDSARGGPGANDNGSGTAAVLELARLLKTMQPSRGTEVKFVFFVNEEPPFFMGEQMGSMQHARALEKNGHRVAGALILETVGWYAQTQNSQRLPPGPEKQYPSTGNFIAFVGTLESSALVRQALAAFRAESSFPAEGLAAPAHVMGVTLSDHSAYNRQGYPALMITDTAFLRYPYYHTGEDTPDKLDYASMARVVKGLARTIEALAGPART